MQIIHSKCKFPISTYVQVFMINVNHCRYLAKYSILKILTKQKKKKRTN